MTILVANNMTDKTKKNDAGEEKSLEVEEVAETHEVQQKTKNSSHSQPIFPDKFFTISFDKILSYGLGMLGCVMTISYFCFNETQLSLISLVQLFIQMLIMAASNNKHAPVMLLMSTFSLFLLGCTFIFISNVDILMSRYHVIVEYALSEEYKNSNNGMLALGLREYTVRFNFVVAFVSVIAIVNLLNCFIICEVIKFKVKQDLFKKSINSKTVSPLLKETNGEHEDPGRIV